MALRHKKAVQSAIDGKYAKLMMAERQIEKFTESELIRWIIENHYDKMSVEKKEQLMKKILK